MKWMEIAQKIGAVEEDNISGGSDFAKKALCEMFDTSFFAEGVISYVQGDRCSELIRSAFWLLKPIVAMETCYCIYQSNEYSLDQKRNAIELLKVISDERSLNWFPDIMASEDFKIQCLAAELLGQLVYEDLVDDNQVKKYIGLLENHEHWAIKEEAEAIRNMLNE